jgi:AraC-like DNA-binding protein
VSTDVLSEVLQAVRLRGAVFFDVDARSPWVAEAPPAEQLLSRVMPGSQHLIPYHVVTEGSCWGGLTDETHTKVEKGSVVVFPHGDAHVMGSRPGMRAEPGLEIYERPFHQQLPRAVSFDGAGTELTTLVCGFLGCDVLPFNPLLSALPKVLIVADGATEGWISRFIELARVESRQRRPGGEAVLAKLSELMFIEVVRRHLEAQSPDQSGWLAGLRDEQVGRALALLHARTSEAWSVDSLAREVGMSRSALAERFSKYMGEGPIQYLARWRMQVAAFKLAEGNETIASIASQSGYESEAAFSRAFKRLVGVPPAAWRKGARSQEAPRPQEQARR